MVLCIVFTVYTHSLEINSKNKADDWHAIIILAQFLFS